MHRRFTVLLFVALVLFAAIPVMAQEQTAAIHGTITDGSGAVLPGVTLEAVNAKGQRFSAVSDTNGNYRFPSIPPGSYTVTATLSGMEPARVSNIDLRLGQSPRIDMTMKLGAVAEQITVTAEAPLVDVTSSATAASISSATIEKLPKARDFSSVVTQVAGANSESKSGGIQIDGASGSENRYLIDGVDTTHPRTGTQGRVVITDFIDEVQVKSAGYQAEFGGATGGVVSVITKTGTNDFHGTLGAYYLDSGLGGGERRPLLRTDVSGNAATYERYGKDDVKQVEPNISLAGPILRDKLWFFGGYSPQKYTTDRKVTFVGTTTPATFSQDFDRENYAATISGGIGSSFLFKVGGNNSGFEQTNLLPGVDGRGASSRSSYEGRKDKLESWSYSAYADYIPSPSFLFSARGGRFYRNDSQAGYPADLRVQFSGGSPRGAFPSLVPAGSPLDKPAGYITASNSATLFDEYQRDNMSFDVSWFPEFAGTHRIKAGAQIENLENNVLTGEQAPLIRFYWDRVSPFSGTMRGTYGTARVRTFRTEGSVKSDNVGFFLQDSWTTMNDRLTVNVGVRTEQERVPNYADPSLGLAKYAIEFKYGDKIAPRLGFSYDVKGDGRWKAYGSYGKFYDITKLEMPRGSFGGDKWIDWQFGIETIDWASIKCTGVSNNQKNQPTCTGLKPLTSVNLRLPSLDLIEPNLKPIESEEFSVGLEHEFSNTLALGGRFVSKKLNRTIEDVGVLVTFPDGSSAEEYFIANPGFGVAQKILAPECPTCPAMPKAKRDYRAFELEATKRFSNNWSLHGSYVNSRLYGNYSGLASSDENGRTSPNVNRYFDNLFSAFNGQGKAEYGLLATDRPHQFKAQIVYQMPWGTSVGINEYVASGTPITSDFTYDGVSGFYAYGRGDMGRTPMYKQTDLALQHDFRIAGKYGVQLGINVLNLFDSDTATNVDSVYSTASIAGVSYADFFKGFDAKSKIPSPATNKNPTYGYDSEFQGSREVRLNVRFIF